MDAGKAQFAGDGIGWHFGMLGMKNEAKRDKRVNQKKVGWIVFLEN